MCASALNAQLVQADMVNAPSSQVSSSQVAETGGQLSVVDEAGQIKAILSNIQGKLLVLQPSLALKQIAALLSHSQWMSRVDT